MRRALPRVATGRAWLARTFLRPRSVKLLHIAAPTREQLAALAGVIDDMSNPRSSPPGPEDIRSANH